MLSDVFFKLYFFRLVKHSWQSIDAALKIYVANIFLKQCTIEVLRHEERERHLKLLIPT